MAPDTGPEQGSQQGVSARWRVPISRLWPRQRLQVLQEATHPCPGMGAYPGGGQVGLRVNGKCSGARGKDCTLVNPDARGSLEATRRCSAGRPHCHLFLPAHSYCLLLLTAACVLLAACCFVSVGCRCSRGSPLGGLPPPPASLNQGDADCGVPERVQASEGGDHQDPTGKGESLAGRGHWQAFFFSLPLLLPLGACSPWARPGCR